MSQLRKSLRINLGGEGEVLGIINQQGPWVLSLNWASSRQGETLQQLASAKHDFLICRNEQLPLPDDSVDEVFTDSVPIDIQTHLGPGVPTKEIERILKSGGVWIRDGQWYYTKP